MADEFEGWDEREAEVRRKQQRQRPFDDDPPEGFREIRFDDPDHKTILGSTASVSGAGEASRKTEPLPLTYFDGCAGFAKNAHHQRRHRPRRDQRMVGPPVPARARC